MSRCMELPDSHQKIFSTIALRTKEKCFLPLYNKDYFRMSLIRRKAIAGLQIGDKFSVSRTFSEQDVIQFAELSRDYNPIHFDERFIRVKNFDGLICHGLLVASLVTEIGGQIGWLASGMSFAFKKPVYIGDTIKCDLSLIEIDARGRAKAEAVLTNQHHITVLEAVLFGIIPGLSEKQVLTDMMNEGDPTNKVSYEKDQ